MGTSVSVGTARREPVLTIREQIEDTPVVDAVRVGKQLKITCPWCGKAHWHGAHSTLCDGCACELHAGYWRPGPCTCPAGAGDGHRTSHCTIPGAPWRGYVLREVRP